MKRDQGTKREREGNKENMTIYRNRLQDTEIDRDSLMYIGNEREG